MNDVLNLRIEFEGDERAWEYPLALNGRKVAAVFMGGELLVRNRIVSAATDALIKSAHESGAKDGRIEELEDELSEVQGTCESLADENVELHERVGRLEGQLAEGAQMYHRALRRVRELGITESEES